MAFRKPGVAIKNISPFQTPDHPINRPRIERFNLDGIREENYAIKASSIQASSIQVKMPYKSRNFNFSMLNTYMRCPQEFFYKYVNKLKPAKKHATIFQIVGNVLHETAANVQVAVKSQKKEFKKEDVTVLVKESEKQIRESFIANIKKEKGIKETAVVEKLISKPEIQETIKKSTEKIKKYVKKEVATPIKAHFTEMPFKFKMGKDIVFYGTWDRVNRNEESGEAEIIEYKSHSNPQFRYHDFQMYIYGYAYYTLFDVVPKLTIKSLSSDQWASQTPTVSKLNEVKEKILKYIKEIRKGDYNASPSPKVCSNCKFAFECPHSMKSNSKSSKSDL